MELVLVEAATAWCSLHRSKNLDTYKAIVAKLLSDGVCPRCCLRVLGHKKFEDYKLPLKTSIPELIAQLKPACTPIISTSAASPAVAPAAAAGHKRPLSEQASFVATLSPSCDTAGPEGSLALPAGHDCEGGEPPAKRQATDTNYQQHLPAPLITPPTSSAPNGDQNSCNPHDSVTIIPFTACIMCLGCVQTLLTPAPSAALPPSASSVNPHAISPADHANGVATDPLPITSLPSPASPTANHSLGVNAASSVRTTASDAAAATAAAAATPESVATGSVTPTAPATAPAALTCHVFDLTVVDSSHPADIVAHIQRQGLTYSSLGMEVKAPTATVAREYQVYCHLRSVFQKNGVLAGWKYEHIVSIQTVIRCGGEGQGRMVALGEDGERRVPKLAKHHVQLD